MFQKRTPPPGASPGTLALATDAVPPRIRAVDYDAERLDEQVIHQVAELGPLIARDSVTWIDVQGLGDEAVLRDLAELLSLHPLIIEDVANAPQRPKTEGYGAHQLIIARLLGLRAIDELEAEQVTIVVGPTYVATFQERYGDVLDPVRSRLRAARGLIRTSGPDYLAYALLDTIVDGYFAVLETLGDQLEELEDDVLSDPSQQVLQRLHHIKSTLVHLRRIVWAQRDALSLLVRGDAELFSPQVCVYLRDTHDHINHVAEMSDSFRELVSGLMNTHLAVVNNRMNEVMKVLTVMASIFIPLTFLAGIYGMNFEHMPELKLPWAYPALWLIMLAVGLGMVVLFRRKGWLGRAPGEGRGEQRKPWAD